jgi:Leucine-rich repeat (LRR) protein
MRYHNYITDSNIKYLSGSITTICFLILSSLVYHTVCVKHTHSLNMMEFWIADTRNLHSISCSLNMNNISLSENLTNLKELRLSSCRLTDLGVFFFTSRVNNDYNMPVSLLDVGAFIFRCLNGPRTNQCILVFYGLLMISM